MDPTLLNQSLKQEIDLILNHTNLMEVLGKFGEVQIIGSYRYDLMAWKDFDLILKLPEFNEENITKLIEQIRKYANPTQLKVNDHLTNLKHGSLRGIWTGIYLKEGWKIDLWLLDQAGFTNQVKQMQEIREMVRAADKNIIIRIKAELAQDPDYHKKFSSVDLYNAVCKDGITDQAGFYFWLKTQRIPTL